MTIRAAATVRTSSSGSNAGASSSGVPGIGTSVLSPGKPLRT